MMNAEELPIEETAQSNPTTALIKMQKKRIDALEAENKKWQEADSKAVKACTDEIDRLEAQVKDYQDALDRIAKHHYHDRNMISGGDLDFCNDIATDVLAKHKEQTNEA